MVKVAVTVNLGNYESLKVESSEFFSVADCKAELNNALKTFHEPRVDDFRKRILMEVTQ